MTVTVDARYKPLIDLLTDEDVRAIEAARFERIVYAPEEVGTEEGISCPRARIDGNEGHGYVCCLFGVAMVGDPERATFLDPDETEDPLLGGTPGRDYVYGWLEDRRGAPVLGLPEYTAEATELNDLKEALISEFDGFYAEHPHWDVNEWVRQLLALRGA